MNLTFFDRTAAPVAAAAQIVFTHAGTVTFTAGAVRSLNLARLHPVRLLRDAAGRWHAHFGQVAGRESAVLASKHSKGAALGFNHIAAVRAFYEQFSISAERRSVSLPLSTTPHQVEELRCYGIDTTALGLPATPALPAEFAEPAPAPSAPEPVAVALPTEPAPLPAAAPALSKARGNWSEEEVQQLRDGYAAGHGPTALSKLLGRTAGSIGVKASELKIARPSRPARRTADKPVKPTAKVVTAAPVLPATRAQGEKVSQYWYGRELGVASDRELADIIDVLSRLSKNDAGLYETSVLDRARKEQKQRNHAA